MTYIDAESNRSRIVCIMVVAESDWMRIQNLPNRIGCGVKNIRVRTPLIYIYTVAIGKPERHVHKASHCGSKQQRRSPDEITLLLLVRATNIYGCCSSPHHVRGGSHIQCNTNGEVATFPNLKILVYFQSAWYIYF